MMTDRDDYDQPRNTMPSDELPEGAVGICTLCDRPRYLVVPQFPTTRVCVCSPVLPLLDRPPPPPAEPIIKTCPVCLKPGFAALNCPCGYMPDDPPLPPLTQGEQAPPAPPPPVGTVPSFPLYASDPAASYLVEILACFDEGDPVGAFGWLFGLFNNNTTMRADPEAVYPLRQCAEKMRVYWTEQNPQRGHELPPTDHNSAKG